MKQALVLCGGRARRLRPYSYGLPKACLPFLNLPLLSYSWLYLEILGVSRFFLNSHLFPEKLSRAVNFLSQPRQKADIFPETKPLGGAGTLRALKGALRQRDDFFYLNGDSLFFPSSEQQLLNFEEDFLKSEAEAAFFCAPLDPKEALNLSGGALWGCGDFNLKFAGARRLALDKGLDFTRLLPFKFSGLALFKSSLLESLKAGAFDLFQDFINPLAPQKKFKIFADPGAKILEAGDRRSYIESMTFCLNILFAEKGAFAQSAGSGHYRKFKKILEKIFSRFDAEDQIVGLKNGKALGAKLGFPLLAPESLSGADYLELGGPAVLGAGACFFGKSFLKEAVLGSQLAWRGNLEKDIVLNFSL